MTGVGSILGGAFGLLGRRPVAILVWAAIYLVLSVGGWVLLAPTFLAMLQTISTLGPDATPAEQAAAMQGMNSVGGLSWLLNILGYFIAAVLFCGAFRAVVRPGEGAFASLRLGWDEVRIFAMFVVVVIAWVILAVILVLLVLLLTFLVVMVAGNASAAAWIVGAVLWIAAIVLTLYLWVRISLIFPLTFIHRRLVVDEAWALTRGRAGTLFLSYLVISLILFALSIAVATPFALLLLSSAPLASGELTGQAALQLAQQWFQDHLAAFALLGVAMSVVQAVSVALYGGAMASAALGFLADDGKLPAELAQADEGVT